MSAHVTRKRAREDSTVEEGSPARNHSDTACIAADGSDGAAMKRDEEFWWDDGTVFLVTRDIEFRVYSGVLALHSPVFRELFSQTHPIRTVSINGKDDVPCPVVTLTDSPEDLRHVLRVYMPRRNASMLVTEDPSFVVISAHVRLGKKYRMTSMYNWSLEHLRSYFPSDLYEWTNSRAWGPRNWPVRHAIGVINLARMTGELDLLPVAFMSCITVPHVVRGFIREDGLQEHLTLVDLDICFEAKTELRKASIKVLFDTLAPVAAPDCKTASTCSNGFRNALAGFRPSINDLMDDDPFFPYTKYLDDGKLTVCAACLAMTNARCWDGRQRLWDRLPRVMGIHVPGWGEHIDTAVG